MTLEEFNAKRRKERKIEDFISLKKEEQLYYDFTNDTNSSKYKENLDIINKYFIYRARHTKIDNIALFEKNHPKAYNYISNIQEKREYDGIYDPDSNSPFLQEIYNKLWYNYQLDKKDYMKYSNDGFISGDTMTSFATSLNISLGGYYTSARCFDEYDGGKGQKIINAILSNHNLYEFMKLYHTIGNFIPVPYGPEPYYGFNVNRSNFGKHDYFHLALLKIKEYYKNRNDEILKELLNDVDGKKTALISNTKAWLNEFGDYKTFVIDNYLQDYDKYLNKLNKLIPWDEGKRKYKNNNKFLKLQCKIIKRRSKRMLKKLSKD
nr:hypothetical protein [Bacilli bacterium]